MNMRPADALFSQLKNRIPNYRSFFEHEILHKDTVVDASRGITSQTSCIDVSM